ncbi:hypothetical protein [Amycolatopsis sp. GM8]|uniref:hypothetical protein n=1 Tax=Amycolatopsis sp. GM8 TaxID=2896530 RepID=UPI001F325206|nr:hypothetical protein [Amycolatopsis sp. GM8]
MSGENRLPEGFGELERFAGQWAIETSDERKKARIRSTPEERQAFYEAATPLAARGLAYLDTIPLDTWDEPAQELMRILLSLAHISLAVEKQGDEEAHHAINHAHFTITRSTETAATTG